MTYHTEMDFADYLEEWIKQIKHSIKLSTWETYETELYRHIIPYFRVHKCKLSKLTTSKIQSYCNEVLENGRVKGKGGLSPKTVRNHHGIIRKALYDAMKQDIITKNPAEMVTLPRKEKYKPQIYSLEQLNHLIQFAKETDMYIPILLGAHCGLRRGEIMGLKWHSVDIHEKTLLVQESVVRAKTTIKRADTKTNSSYRKLKLPDALAEALKKHKEEQKECRRLFGKKHSDHEYVCSNPDGSQCVPSTFTKKVQRVMEQAGLPVIRLHDLRHTHASLLMSFGVNYKEIQEQLGHSDISTTLNIYTHLEYSSKEKIASLCGKNIAV